MTKIDIGTGLAAMVALLVHVGHAAAQTAGTYTGTSADGSAISITLANDTNNQLAITVVQDSYSVTCPKNVPGFQAASGYGADVVIPGTGKFALTEQYEYLNQRINGRFNGDTVTGTIYSATPTINFTTGARNPTKAVVCTSPLQAFNATLQAAATARTQQPSNVTVYSIHR